MNGSTDSYLDLAKGREQFLAEPIDFVVETTDYYDVSVTPPGEYLSVSRTIEKIANKVDPVTNVTSTTFTVLLTGGIRSLGTDGSVYNNGKFPLRGWLSTKLFEQTGKPGKTSQAAQYLKEAGFDPKGLDRELFLEAMEASLTTPMKVYIAWKDRGVKQPDGSYKDLKLKTKDFITGQREDGSPIYSPVITVNGVEVKATEKIASFRAFA